MMLCSVHTPTFLPVPTPVPASPHREFSDSDFEDLPPFPVSRRGDNTS